MAVADELRWAWVEGTSESTSSIKDCLVMRDQVGGCDGAGRRRERRVEGVAVLHQQLRFFISTCPVKHSRLLAIEPCDRIGGQGMRSSASPCGRRARRRVPAPAARPSRPSAGSASSTPRLDQRAADRAVLTRQTRLDLQQGQQRARNLCFQQPVAVVGGYRRVETGASMASRRTSGTRDCRRSLRHQHPFGAHGEECLQRRRPQQHLRRDRGPTHRRIEPFEALVQRPQGFIRQRLDRPQRMIRRNVVLQPTVRKQALQSASRLCMTNYSVPAMSRNYAILSVDESFSGLLAGSL